ncbi:hypothetical protein ACNOYE_01925 [Nannocystaceae bacterium ST9]
MLTPIGLLLAQTAEAGRPQGGGGFDEGGYIQGSPGVVSITAGQDDFSSDFELAWPWSFGGGWMFARGPVFKATLGGAFEHHIMFFDRADFGDFNGHSLHFLAESRIGAGNNKVWGYGLMGFGPSVTLLHWNNAVFDDTEAFGGVNFQLGGGVQGIVYRNLFLGGEFDIDLGFYFDSSDRIYDDDFQYHMATLKFLIGWYF